MSNPELSAFLTNYIMSLGERTRVDKKGITLGFDWIIYNLGLAKNWTPTRLPFYRRAGARAGKTKTEPEFGIDISFLTKGCQELYIFVLKDEELNNKNWNRSDMDSDLRKASVPDLSAAEFRKVRKVTVILCYNKDEDQTGIRLFQNLTASLGKKVARNAALSFERWNLTRIVGEVEDLLLTPQLLPQHLSSQFNYLCSQLSDFEYESHEWSHQLIPNWKSFLRSLLRDPVDERELRLVPVTLMILLNHRKASADSYAGWIDLAEWAMLSLWECYRSTKKKKLRSIVVDSWLRLYLAELERYFVAMAPAFQTEHGLHSQKRGLGLVAVNDAYIAYWHVGRLGILTLGLHELMNTTKEAGRNAMTNLINRSYDWLTACLRANPGSMRPLLYIHHIELFLIWMVLWQGGNDEEIYKWLTELESRLLIRRVGKAQVPFIEARNRMDLVAEYAATSAKPPEFVDDASYLLLMILEICCSLKPEYRDSLLDRIYKRIIMGTGDDGTSVVDKEINLIGWAPPVDWSERILGERVMDGVAIVTNNFTTLHEQPKPLWQSISEFVQECRKKFPFDVPTDLPLSGLILACIKHQSPLPAELWRGTIFPNSGDSAK